MFWSIYSMWWEIYMGPMIFTHIILWVIMGLHVLGWNRAIFHCPQNDSTENGLIPGIIIIFWPVDILLTLLVILNDSYERGQIPGSNWLDRVVYLTPYSIGWTISQPFKYLLWVIGGYGRNTKKS